MPKKFMLKEEDLSYAINWLEGALKKGILDASQRHIDAIENASDAQRVIERDLDKEDIRKLQVAIAVRKSRKKNKTRMVKTELEPYAREILLAVAQSRNITTSELIEQTFANEHDKLPNI